MDLKTKCNKLAILLFCCIFTLLCLTSFSLSVNGAPEENSFTVTDGNGNPVSPDGNGLYTLTSGSYTAAGTTRSHSINIIGDVTLTLHNAMIDLSAITIENAAPGIGIAQGKVTLILEGENTVNGGSGFAGIYVSEKSSLTVSGQGTLAARGGDGKKSGSYSNKWHGIFTSTRCYFGGAAGIGGNGLWLHRDDTWVTNSVPSFGTILIESGNITAQGGKANITNAGAGAGIGAGGSSSQKSINYSFTGTIAIKNGTVKAVGGMGEDFSLTLGGAGIGSGGVGGNIWVPYHNEIKVSISGGTVTAAGTADGAGIGGGANVNGGIIEISGGTVTATGGYETENGQQSGHWGGAGIGGGDNGGLTSVLISGNAKVTAKAIGAAAGIGAGCDGFVGTIDYDTEQMTYGGITIDSMAEVTASGGSNPSKKVGGAGIGAGCSYNFDNGFGHISITGQAKVRAYAGARAQAIGVGSDYAGDDPNTFSVGTKSIDVWMFNQDTAQTAFWGQNEAGSELTEDFVTAGAQAVWYTLPQGETFPDTNTVLPAFISPDAKALFWQHTTNGTVQLLQDTQSVAECTYRSDGFTTLGNWAAFFSPAETGNLIVSQTTDVSDDANKDFSFTVILDDSDINGTYGDMIFSGGTASFTLKSGESKTALNLPAGISYKVEAMMPDGYTIAARNPSGILPSNETVQISFRIQRAGTPSTPKPSDDNSPPSSTGDSIGLSLWLLLLTGAGLLPLCLKKQNR